MSKPTKEELLDFMRKHGPEKVDSITDTESAIRHFRCTSKVYKEQRDQYKIERDTLIDDITALKENVRRLKQENGDLREVIEGKNTELLFTEDENEQLKQDLLRTEELQDEIIQLEKDFENKHNILSEISQHIGNKPSSSTYKYFRAKLDGIEIKEGE